MQVYVIMCSTHSGESEYDCIESIWASKELAEEELARLKKNMQPYQYPHQIFSIAQETVYGYRGY